MIKVMIVDDEYDIRQGLKKIINWEEQGYTIIGEAADGDEALTMFKKSAPNLIITDIKMPGTDGLELARKMREEDSNVKMIILSGHDDFTYARKAIMYDVESYLLKPVDPNELCEELTNIRETLEKELITLYREREKEKWIHDFFFRKLVRGEPFQENEFKHNDWLMLKNYECFVMLMVELDDFDESLLQLSESDILLKKFAIRNVLEEIVEDTGIGIVYEENNHRLGILLSGSTSQLTQLSIKSLTNKMIEFTECYAKQFISIGVGHKVYRKEEISSSYQKASLALEKSFFNPKQQVYYHNKINTDLAVWSLDWTAYGLTEAVEQLNRIEMDHQLDILFQELNAKDAPFETIRDVLVYTLVKLSHVVIEADGDWSKLYFNHFGESDWVTDVRTSGEAKQGLKGICLDIIDYLLKKRNNPIQNNISEIVHYIDKNYWEELNLKKLADFFYVSPAYLGQLFKRETGQYFNDYLNQVRIKKAQQLLLNKNLTILDISEKVGYKNTNHFYIHFKNLTHLNPGDYRKRNLEV